MKGISCLVVLATVLAGAFAPPPNAGGDWPARARDQVEGRGLPESIAELRLPSPRIVSGISVTDMGFPVFGANGVKQVVVRLRTDAVAETSGDSPKAREDQRNAIEAEQLDFLRRLLEVAPEAKVLGRVKLVLNAVLVEVGEDILPGLSRDPAVLRITPVFDYKLALSDTVPYIGGSAVQDLGVDGSGVRVAVLDTGVDYTHAHLNGPGTEAAYKAAYGAGPSDPRNSTTDRLFPTAKVVGGFYFVGEAWPAGPWVKRSGGCVRLTSASSSARWV